MGQGVMGSSPTVARNLLFIIFRNVNFLLRTDGVCLCDDNADKDFCASLQKSMQEDTHI